MLAQMQGRIRIGAARWATVVLAAGGLLALPAGALASAYYRGVVGSGVNNAGLDLRVKFHKGDPIKVLEFRWYNVPVGSCYDSFDGTRFSMKVNDRGRFHGTYSVPHTDHKATVRGKFKHHDKKMAGTLELKGDFVGGCSNADSGKLDWTAKRAGTG